MALKNLTTETMLQISAGWLDAKLRPVLEGVGEVAPLVPRIEAVHRELAGSRKSGDGNAALAKNRRKAEAKDVRHDRKSRGTYLLLSSLAELAEHPETAQQYLDARDRLLPKGLSVTTMSYTAEAGNATLVRQELDAPLRALLKKVKTVENRTLDDEVSAWLAAAADLGALEDERLELERAAREGAARADAARARNRWIKLANALVSNLELAEADDATVHAILGRLREEEAKADRRAADRGKGEDEGPGTAPPGAGGEQPA